MDNDELSTNLASLGTDCISRQSAIDALRTCYDTETITMDNGDEYINYGDAVGEIEQLPPIQSKLLQPWEVLVAQAVLPQPEPCEDAVKSHSEKDILNMCISLLDEMVGYFGEYMEWIGYEPTKEEKVCGYFGMTYFHIVQKLFLYHTTHSGGTSTFKKCHELGIDDPSDGVRVPLWKEEEGDSE